MSEDRVKKALAEAYGVKEAGPKKPPAPKKNSTYEEAKKKTALALAKKRAENKAAPKGTEPAMI